MAWQLVRHDPDHRPGVKGSGRHPGAGPTGFKRIGIRTTATALGNASIEQMGINDGRISACARRRSGGEWINDKAPDDAKMELPVDRTLISAPAGTASAGDQTLSFIARSSTPVRERSAYPIAATVEASRRCPLSAGNAWRTRRRGSTIRAGLLNEDLVRWRPRYLFTLTAGIKRCAGSHGGENIAAIWITRPFPRRDLLSSRWAQTSLA